MGTVATTHALFLLFLAEALLGLEFLEFSCGHGDAGGCAAVELPVGSKMGHGGHHVMIHIWQRQWTHLAFAGSGLLQGFGHHELTGNTICIFCLRPRQKVAYNLGERYHISMLRENDHRSIANISRTATINEASNAFQTLNSLIGDATGYRRNTARGIEKRELLWTRLPNESASFRGTTNKKLNGSDECGTEFWSSFGERGDGQKFATGESVNCQYLLFQPEQGVQCP